MKKLISWTAAAAMTLSLALSGCGGSTGQTTPPPAEDPGSGPQTQAPANEGESKKKYELKFSIEGGLEDSLTKGVLKWFDDFNSRSETAEVNTYPNGQLGNKNQNLEGMLMGETYIVTADASYLSDFVPGIDIVSGPYFVLTPEECEKIVYTDWWKEQEQKAYEAGIKIINATFFYGQRHLLATRPVRTPEDMKGLKIRVPSNDLSIKIMEGMGATATPLPIGEMYTSLSQGVVDGAENPITTLCDNKLYECAKYLSLTGHQTMFITTIMGAQAWDRLSPEDQELLLSTGLQAAEEYNTTTLEADLQDRLDIMTGQGVEVIDDVDVEAFREMTRSVYEDSFDQELYDEIQRQIAEVTLPQ